MSLILDALRKADAERERGSVPSLHAQPVLPRSTEAPLAPRQRPTWVWTMVGLAAGLTIAAAWVMFGREATPTPTAAHGDATPMSAPPAASGQGAPGGATARAPVAAVPVPAPPAAEPAPWPQRDAPRRDAPVPTLTAPSVPTLTAPSVAPAESVVSREQLPAHVRAELPAFTIGGSMYSSNPASRSLIVNGQLYRERDRLTADLSLEEIRQKAAIFSFRGHRFEVVF